MEANTLLFYDTKNGKYVYHRPWDNGKGYINGWRDSKEGLIESMESSRKLFSSSYVVDRGVPNLDWGNFDPNNLKPMEENDVEEVRKALKGI